MAAENVLSDEKGRLFYQTPEKASPFRVIAVLFHIILFIIGILLNILLIVSIIIIIVLIILAITEGIRPPNVRLGNTSGFHWFSIRYLHKRVRVYEKGITKPLDAMKAQLHPEAEGEFIPFRCIRGYRMTRNDTAFELVYWSERCEWETSVVYEDRPKGVLKILLNYLESHGAKRLREKR